MIDPPIPHQPLRVVTGRATAKSPPLHVETSKWETEHEMLTLYLNSGFLTWPRRMNIKTVSAQVVLNFRGYETQIINAGNTPIGMNIGYIASARNFILLAKPGTTFTYEYWTDA